MLINLSKDIKETGFDPDVIVGVSRGGWTPARVLSDLLLKPEIANIKVEFYLGVEKTKEEPKITQPVSINVEVKRLLVVDDVSDTGKSLRLVKEYLIKQGARDIRIATLYYKPWSITVPDFYQKTTKSWVIFPWERKEAFRKVIERFTEEGRPIKKAISTLIDAGFDSSLARQFHDEISEGNR
jgi:hypoxanthine phosphoribosyltransferase